ncbi:MAG: DUF2891 family protein [Theionarchaea archaeon]|nr:DUF2891 family protein [Theionarchaea archaeon]
MSHGAGRMLDDFDGRIDRIDSIGIIPSKCIELVDQVHGDKTLFHGCHDWHSSVHGHWALLRMDLTGSGRHHDEVTRVGKRFTEAKISAVIDELEQAPRFEMPYGRAWLLKLVVEYERWVQVNHVPPPGSWRRLGDHAAESLRVYYLEGSPRRTPDILSNQYRNDSFAIVQLYDYFRHRGDEGRLAAVRDYINEHFIDDSLHFDPESDRAPRAFLSPFWSWIYLLVKTQPDEALRELVDVDEIGDEWLRPMARQEVSRGRVHHLGMNWSRAWAIKCLARRMSSWDPREYPAERLVKSYHAHLEEGLRAHDDFVRAHPDIEEEEAYYSYYHWVPQFGIYAITD